MAQLLMSLGPHTCSRPLSQRRRHAHDHICESRQVQGEPPIPLVAMEVSTTIARRAVSHRGPHLAGYPSFGRFNGTRALIDEPLSATICLARLIAPRSQLT